MGKTIAFGVSQNIFLFNRREHERYYCYLHDFVKMSTLLVPTQRRAEALSKRIVGTSVAAIVLQPSVTT